MWEQRKDVEKITYFKQCFTKSALIISKMVKYPRGFQYCTLISMTRKETNYLRTFSHTNFNFSFKLSASLAWLSFTCYLKPHKWESGHSDNSSTGDTMPISHTKFDQQDQRSIAPKFLASLWPKVGLPTFLQGNSVILQAIWQRKCAFGFQKKCVILFLWRSFLW